MTPSELLEKYHSDPRPARLAELLAEESGLIHLKGLSGSFTSILMLAASRHLSKHLVIVCEDKEKAAYFHNDLENLLEREGSVLFFPESFRAPYAAELNDNAQIAMRAEVLNKLARSRNPQIVVTYPEALAEKVINKKSLKTHTYRLAKGEQYDMEFIHEVMHELGFDLQEYVFEPGQYAVRGGIVDIFSFASEYPYRVEFFGNEVDSVRLFNPVDQLSVKTVSAAEIVPNVSTRITSEAYQSLLDFSGAVAMAVQGYSVVIDRVGKAFERASQQYLQLSGETKHRPPEDLYLSEAEITALLAQKAVADFGLQTDGSGKTTIDYHIKPQPEFSKNFEMLADNLKHNEQEGFKNLIFSSNPKQLERLHRIFEDIEREAHFTPVASALHGGFIDTEQKLALYTDHQIFERYHRFRLKEGYKKNQQAMTIRELNSLQPGDFVTHIDHGVGVFSGLEKIKVNGKEQEAIRLKYRDNDLLYVSIHSLHRISKYSGKDGSAPKVNKLGSGAWAKSKAKAKSRVKEIAYDLIKLYAKRKASQGFAFSPDNYLQTELEASFIYEDTPDQLKATQDVKADMESESPMDRLICGDVGFGKTEIAIRAAFKAVCDSKQVAVLVPTTILSLQHFKNFSDRLRDFPCKVDYINRFKSQKKQTETLKKLAAGEIDIIIGTHKLVGSKVKFKDLGLLIIDEEQKFGVGVKDKLKTLREHVDTLTMTATPIPRTLQFSMMKARDLSIINTPPPNRHPVFTEVRSFSEEMITEAVNYEVGRGGQVFVVNNKIQNIKEVAAMIQRNSPGTKVGIGHGQMPGEQLEQVMLDFMDGLYDVLVATTIVESGIDIPNANTMIIIDAHKFGLSDLHQLRGRVGRSNKKAFCYLIAPPVHHLNDEARKRLQAIEQFSDLGSGLNIAMRDLDIRGAGDLLGADQSGFITDVGFDTYQKILNEAIEELQETEFKDLYLGEKSEFAIKDCTLETDFEILIPDDYIVDTAERLQVYRELDDMNTLQDLKAYQANLEDRFGKVPRATLDLFRAIELRWMAQRIGLEKLILKSGKLIAHFGAPENSDYFQSPQFSQVLQVIQQNPRDYKMYEKQGKLRLAYPLVESIDSAIDVLDPLVLKNQ
jgi:transcription-repair coupling factor (superfamily II helicase)